MGSDRARRRPKTCGQHHHRNAATGAGRGAEHPPSDPIGVPFTVEGEIGGFRRLAPGARGAPGLAATSRHRVGALMALVILISIALLVVSLVASNLR